jgi:hypothetical protein
MRSVGNYRHGRLEELASLPGKPQATKPTAAQEPKASSQRSIFARPGGIETIEANTPCRAMCIAGSTLVYSTGPWGMKRYMNLETGLQKGSIEAAYHLHPYLTQEGMEYFWADNGGHVLVLVDLQTGKWPGSIAPLDNVVAMVNQEPRVLVAHNDSKQCHVSSFSIEDFIQYKDPKHKLTHWTERGQIETMRACGDYLAILFHDEEPSGGYFAKGSIIHIPELIRGDSSFSKQLWAPSRHDAPERHLAVWNDYLLVSDRRMITITDVRNLAQDKELIFGEDSVTGLEVFANLAFVGLARMSDQNVEIHNLESLGVGWNPDKPIKFTVPGIPTHFARYKSHLFVGTSTGIYKVEMFR